MRQAWRNAVNAVTKSIFGIYMLLLVISSRFYFTFGGNTLSRGEFISGSKTIVSQEGTFELGFFIKGSTRAYLGIWYRNSTEKTIVWVANRERPLLNTLSDPRLEVSQNGNLVLFHESATIWSPNLMSALPNSIEAVILDNGNFVLRDSSKPSIFFWQSFDHPTDTWLPGAKLGFKKHSPRSQIFISWKNSEDPSPGLFSVVVDDRKPDQYFLEWNMSVRYSTSGIWNGGIFSDVPEMSYTSKFNLTSNENETYFTYSLYNDAILTRYVIYASGELKQFTSYRGNLAWSNTFVLPRNQSEVYGSCGAFSIFNESHSNSCKCLQGFTSYSTEDPSKINGWSGGCVRKISLQCENRTSVKGGKDGFAKISNVRWPSNAMVYPARTAKECEFACTENCSCTAYAYHELECSVWDGALLNILQTYDHINTKDLYLKLAGSELPDTSGKRKTWVVITAVLVPLAVLISAGYLGYHYTRNIKQKGGKYTSEDLLAYDFEYRGKENDNDTHNKNDQNKGARKDFDLPLFSYASISAATNNFSAQNKLGEGGFGPVYKGKSLKGQEIAVKRLSKRSGQGLQEFRNEITLIAKLQHRNLVRLLGYCTEQDENILIYEYMPNKSLDFLLFDPNKQEIVEWGTRVRIIEGVAHGLLYLHEYSRLRIIHRDLKASNILLDSEMNPKISDFGMARIFGGNDAQVNTKRIVGTYGYMAPEYALEGIFSVKSDVFSFGVLVLEIVSGKKNTGFYHSDSLNLLGHVWELWTSDRAKELIDPGLGSPPTNAVLRYINVGLLCVQEYPNDRPTMSNIISMLSNEAIPLIKPKRPAFSTNRCMVNNKSLHFLQTGAENHSVNGITISTIGPR